MERTQIGKALGLTALVATLLTGCASPEARQRLAEDPRGHISKDLRKSADPEGSPYSDSQGGSLLLGIPGYFLPR